MPENWPERTDYCPPARKELRGSAVGSLLEKKPAIPHTPYPNPERVGRAIAPAEDAGRAYSARIRVPRV